MEESVLVHKGQPLEDLIHDVADGGLGEVPVACAHELVEVAIHELEDEEELVVFAYDLFQLDNVRVIQFLCVCTRI